MTARLEFVVGLWRLSRPDQLLLIVWLYVVGAAIAVTEEAAVELLSLTVGGVALLATAASVHYANEYADVAADARTDRTPFSGGSGVIADGILPRSAARDATVVAGAAGGIVGVIAMASGVLTVTAIGLLGAIGVLGWAYSIGPALSRRGLGELDNVLLGGLLLPLYGATVLEGASLTVVLAVLPFCLLVVPNLFATHWADRKADAAVGKRTLAVRWSRRRLQIVHAAFSAMFPVALLALWGWVLPPVVVLAGLPVVPISAVAVYRFTRQHSPAPSVIAMVTCAVLQGLAWLWLAISPA